MKKRTTLVSLLVLLVAYTSTPSPQVVEESTRKQSQSISLILKKTLLTQSRITLIYLNSDDENIYSEVHYTIEKQINNQWIMLKTINNDYAFSSIVFVFEPNTPFESPISWSNYYGLLASGTYRFDVEVYPLNGGDLEFAYAEFEIYT